MVLFHARSHEGCWLQGGQAPEELLTEFCEELALRGGKSYIETRETTWPNCPAGSFDLGGFDNSVIYRPSCCLSQQPPRYLAARLEEVTGYRLYHEHDLKVIVEKAKEPGFIVTEGAVLEMLVSSCRPAFRSSATSYWREIAVDWAVNQCKKNVRQWQEEQEANAGSVVYLIAALKSKLGKIGTTVNLRARIKALQASSPEQLVVLATLPGGITTEKRLHRKYAEKRRHGEWFELTPDIMKEFKLQGFMTP